MHGIIDRIDTQHSFGTEGLMTSEESLEIEIVASVAATTDSKPGEETIADNVSPLHHLVELRHDPDVIRHLFEPGGGIPTNERSVDATTKSTKSIC